MGTLRRFRTYMSLRRLGRLDASLQGRRWQAPIILPAVLALCLVAWLAVQSVRAVQVHRRAVGAALHDYAAFATWQYTRRASDYLRLAIVTRIGFPPARGPLPPSSGFGSVTCDVRGGQIHVHSDDTGLSLTVIGETLARALRNAQASNARIGLIGVGDPRAGQFLGYTFDRDAVRDWSTCTAVALRRADLVPVFHHVAEFAPLLPPSFVGNLPNDSLVSIQVFGGDGAQIAAVGDSLVRGGMSAADVLGPDLAELRVVATLHPVATTRLVAGGLPLSNTPALLTMLAVTLVLCGVAVTQVRRTQEIIRLRSDFVASVSHELKTPLAQISLFADTLAAPRERPLADRRHYATIISREAKRLGQLVDGILHFAGMARSPRVFMPDKPSLLGEEIRAAIAAFQPIADARSVTVEARIDQDVELPLERDPFRQLMLNLLDNALKFGPDGQGILIMVSIRGGYATIHVDDEGPGVPAADRVRVFEPFVRVDRPSGKAGSGIGLAVVRDVVRRHGGGVRVDSSPSGGARVTIELPILPVTARGHATATA